MTKNICVSEWRRANRQQPLAATHNVMTEEAQPMADDDNLRQLQQAISRLPQSEQRLFRMRHELGMDIGQIAAATGLQPRSVSAVISKARRTIIEQLKQGGIIA
jgi:RNA polymerase sigma factor (sigma-70 family)